LSKTYRVGVKQPGFKGTFNHFFNRQYREINAVHQVSFELMIGEMVGFLGSNGAGKTTTLKMLTGLIHASGGTIEVVGYNPTQRQPTFLKKISLVMGQKQQLIWDLPALDSLRINGAVYEIPDKECDRRVWELAEMLDLEDSLRQPMRKLSLGQRMKAELLAALLHRPEVLFLDEPTLGLDINAQVAVRKFLKNYNETYGATILLTSHYMADITALCDRVLMIDHGQLIYDGKLDQLLTQFAPYREIKLDLAQPTTKEHLALYGEVEEVNGQQVRLLVNRANLTTTIEKLLSTFEINDLSVGEPPIEEVIGRIFAEGVV
jgi:ABC-2 type transport system ATP-binding protein